MKRVVVFAIMLLVPAVSLAQAVDGELHGMVDLTYQSQYVWRGFDFYPDTGAIQLTIDLDLFQTGFGLSAQGHRAISSEFEEMKRWDYTLYYQNKLFDGEPYATNYRLGWVYYNFSDHNPEDFDLQELHGVVSLPNILGVKGLVPSYVLVKLWPSHSNSFVGMRSPFGGTASGFAHIFMLDYGFDVPGVTVDTSEQRVNLHSELVFNDGVGPGGQYVEHDFTNAVFGASTDFDLGDGVAFTPALWYQITMDRSVNPDKDELWATLSVRCTF
jgi:hypothetical protein